ncbi:MAG TPA: serine/threonine-protein kinase [Longimicrobiales bacterium]|jgi:serine/threonine protein kinase
MAAQETIPDLPEGLEGIRALGEGSMARVFLARQTDLGRLVAVKILRPELAVDEVARKRFEREARSAASLSHPNVVPVYRFGRLEGGAPFLVMAHIKGRTLADRIAAEGRLSEEDARRVIAEVASALSSAHRNGFVHRDVRPGNVLFDDESGRAMLSDFGIAGVLDEESAESGRLTQTGQVLGNPRYASPEQLAGHTVTAQADVYSLAVTAYETLTGEGPFDASGRREWTTAHLREEPRDLRDLLPGVDPSLADLLKRCLAKEPAHRPTVDDVVKRLLRGPGTAGQDEAPSDLTGLAGLIEDLKSRRVVQIVGGSLVAWVGVPSFLWNLVEAETVPRLIFDLSLVLSVFGVMATAIVAWFHGEKGTQSATLLEKILLGTAMVGWVATTILVILRNF